MTEFREHRARRLPAWASWSNVRWIVAVLVVCLFIIVGNVLMTALGNATETNKVLAAQLEDNGITPAVEVKEGGIGPRGQPGAIGPRGAQGDRGPRGAEGLPGPRGPAGPPGAIGAMGVRGQTGSVGAMGPQGEQGGRGPAPTCEDEPGETCKGNTGEQGPKGDKGDPSLVPGPEGKQGPVGPAGASCPAGYDFQPSMLEPEALVCKPVPDPDP